MRNAAAHFDDDFDIGEPARKTSARRPAPGAKRKKKGKRRLPFRLDMRRTARYGAIVACGTLVAGIVVNALVLQKSRHPAPLFGTSVALDVPRTVVPRPVPRPPLPATPADRQGTPGDAPDASRTALADPVQGMAAHEPDTTATQAPDQIAALLSGAAIIGDKPDPKTIAGVQRALTKLGFAVKPTGTFGPQTRKALEAFEKERHLPVKDDLTRRVIKALAAESGLKIER